MSGRFKLDPRAAEPARPAAAPLPLARPAAPAPPPPRPAPVATAAPAAHPDARRRKLIVLSAAVVALLLVGGAVAVFVATTQGYPEKYVLRSSDHPDGMGRASMSQDDLADLGMTENPGEVDMDQSDLADLLQAMRMDEPDRSHAQILSDSSGARVIILALKYADEDQAKENAKQARALCNTQLVRTVGLAPGVVLRDGDVLVGVLAENGASNTQARAVGQALRDNVRGLAPVCGI
ncbi:MAG TPA: hypothetical protein VM370_13485 [Candidatus Thermoplasmatota archaeon]|nr:hypothetical protein [Candidatus Thermoplasmatota archaeon]